MLLSYEGCVIVYVIKICAKKISCAVSFTNMAFLLSELSELKLDIIFQTCWCHVRSMVDCVIQGKDTLYNLRFDVTCLLLSTDKRFWLN